MKKHAALRAAPTSFTRWQSLGKKRVSHVTGSDLSIEPNWSSRTCWTVYLEKVTTCAPSWHSHSRLRAKPLRLRCRENLPDAPMEFDNASVSNSSFFAFRFS